MRTRSRRLPPALELNEWSARLAARRAMGRQPIDLTESNPTRVGLGNYGEAALAALTHPGSERYEPSAGGLEGAREAVAAYYDARGTPVRAEDVVLTSGTSESYAHLFRLLADPGDLALVPAPSYPLFEPLATLEGVGVAPYRLAWDGAWHLDLASVEAALDRAGDRARLLIAVEPNHPTGTWLSPGERDALEGLLADRGVALVSDEVFADYAWRPGAGPPGFLGDRRVPACILGGLSKCCGLPQLKLSWMVVAGPEPARRELREGLEWIADLFLSVGTPVQSALPVLLGSREGFQAPMRERLAENLAGLEALTRRCPEAGVRAGQGGWSAILELPAAREQEWSLALLERDVLVHPAHFYDLDDERCVVLSLIPEPGVFRAGLERIAGILETF